MIEQAEIQRHYNADRVNYTFGLKINLGNYESATVQASFSSDVKEGETIEEAYKRVQEIVENEVDEKRTQLKGD